MPRRATLSVATALVTTATVFASSAAHAEISLDAPGSKCFIYSEFDPRDAAKFDQYTPDQVPTLGIHGALKEAPGQSLSLTVGAEPPSRALMLGSTFLTPDAAGNLTRKYLNFTPNAIFTNGQPLPTPKIERSTLVVTFKLNDVLRSQARVTFPVGILAATTRAVNERRQRRKQPWKVSGLGPGTYYAHYRRNGKTVWRQRLGEATGDCGYLSARRYVSPPRSKGSGPWSIVIQRSTSFKRDEAQLELRGYSRSLSGDQKFVGRHKQP